MYCSKCGNKVYKGMRECPYCENDLSENEKMEYYNVIADIENVFWGYSETKTVEFSIGNDVVEVKGDYYIYAQLRRFTDLCYMKIIQEMIKYIKRSSLETICRDGENFLKEKMKPIDIAVNIFLKKNDIDITQYIDGLSNNLGIQLKDIWLYAEVLADEIEETQGDIEEIRQKSLDKSVPKRWIGGGFGIKGAIKGQITAGLLNAGASIVNATENVVRNQASKWVLKKEVQKEIKKILNSDLFHQKTIEIFDEYWGTYISTVLQKVVDNKEVANSVINTVAQMEEKQIVKLLPEEALKRLSMNPYDLSSYITLYAERNENGHDLATMAEFWGINDQVLINFAKCDAGELFVKRKIEFRKLGYDVENEELIKIQEELINLEKYNPAYSYILEEPNIKKEYEYKLKVNEMVLIEKIDDYKMIVKTIMRENEPINALMRLLDMHSVCVDNLVYAFLSKEYKLDKTKFIEKYKEALLPIVCDVILDNGYDLERTKQNLEALQNAAKFGRIRAKVKIAQIYYYGIGVEKNKKIVQEYMKDIENSQITGSLDIISNLYKHGDFGYPIMKDISEIYKNIVTTIENI